MEWYEWTGLVWGLLLILAHALHVTGILDEIAKAKEGKKLDNSIFKLKDIKAGYLLVVHDETNNRTFNMTVVPARLGTLGACNPGKDWTSLEFFNSDLVYPGTDKWRINKIYGPTYNRYLLDNSTEDRELLWERKETKKMTVSEICKALGYDVEIVKEHRED